MIVLLVLGGVAFWFAARPDERRADRLRLLVGAVGIRALAAGGISVYLAIAERASLFPDELSYLETAGGGSAGADSRAFASLLGDLFVLTGPSAWLPRWINVVIGAAVAVLVYEIAFALAGRWAARVSGWAVALWPSLVLWSAVVLRDSLVFLALGAALLGAMGALRGSWTAVTSALAGATALALLKPYAFAVFAVAVVLTAVARAAAAGIFAARQAIAVTVLVGAIGALAGLGFLGLGFVADSADLESVAFSRTDGGTGSTGFADPNPRDFGDVLAGIPKGLLFALLGPFPWQTQEAAARALLIVELPLWYATLSLGVVGAWRLRRRLFGEWLLPLVMVGGVVAILAVYGANAGTLLRQRGMVIPLVAVFAAQLLATRWSSGR